MILFVYRSIIDGKYYPYFEYHDGSEWHIISAGVGGLDIHSEWHEIGWILRDMDVEFYLDGNRLATKTLSSLADRSVLTFYQVGGKSIWVSPDWFTGGYMENVRIWNKPLSESEVEQAHSNPYNPPKEDLALWLPFTENRGSRVIDRSGNNNHGTIHDARWVTEWQRGVYFNGRNAYLLAFKYAPQDLTEGTISMWVKVFDFSKNPIILHSPDANRIEFYVTRGGYLNCGIDVGGWQWISTPIMKGVLHLVTFMWDSSGSELYVDAEWRTAKSFDPGSVGLQDLYVGLRIPGIADPSSRGGTNIVSGFYVHSRKLTSNEILQLYLNPDNPPLDGLKLWLPMNEGWGRRLVDHSGNGNHATLYGDVRWV